MRKFYTHAHMVDRVLWWGKRTCMLKEQVHMCMHTHAHTDILQSSSTHVHVFKLTFKMYDIRCDVHVKERRKHETEAGTMNEAVQFRLIMMF